jgi:hypothetical protein
MSLPRFASGSDAVVRRTSMHLHGAASAETETPGFRGTFRSERVFAPDSSRYPELSAAHSLQTRGGWSV